MAYDVGDQLIDRALLRGPDERLQRSLPLDLLRPPRVRLIKCRLDLTSRRRGEECFLILFLFYFLFSCPVTVTGGEGLSDQWSV